MKSPPAPTARQLQILKSIWDKEGQKLVAAELGVDRHTIEYHMSKLRDRLGITYGGRYGTIAMIKWGVRAGVLSALLLMTSVVSAKHHRSPPAPSPSPIPTNYQTNAQAWWPTVSGANAYQLNWGFGNALTFGTNWMITGLTNGSNYAATIQASINGVLSTPSCSVSFTAGSGVINHCP